MSALNDFYTYCQQEDIQIVAYPIGFRSAASLRLRGRRATFFDFDHIRSIPELNWAAAHESGHHHLGAYHKVSSPYQLWQQAEYRADRWAFHSYLPATALAEAMRLGYTEPWQLAEYFGMPEPAIKKALHYWTECRGVDFNTI